MRLKQDAGSKKGLAKQKLEQSGQTTTYRPKGPIYFFHESLILAQDERWRRA
jgi:hypothetical protein